MDTLADMLGLEVDTPEYNTLVGSPNRLVGVMLVMDVDRGRAVDMLGLEVGTPEYNLLVEGSGMATLRTQR